MHRLVVASALAVAVAVPLAARSAEEPPPPQDLEAEIAKELGKAPPGAATAPEAPAPAASQGAAAAGPLARLLLLPDISAVASAAAAFDSLDVETLSPRSGPTSPAGRPAFLFEELELALQAAVDPYARADVFIAFGPEGAELEEAYLTSLSLPAGLQVRAGRFFSPFGRLNQQHPHVWELVDAPLAQSRLLAEETLSGAGVALSWLAPLPWFAELHLAGQSTGELPGEPLPPDGGEPSARLTGVARLLQYVSLGDSTTVGLGLSAARREEQGRGAFRDLGGADLLVRHRRPASRSYATLQAELYARRLRGIPEVDGGVETGGWAQGFYKHGPRFGYGVRYDWAPAEAEGLDGTERRVGVLAAFFPSELQRIRLQVSYDRLPGGRDGLEAILHLEFGIGSHGAHPF